MHKLWTMLMVAALVTSCGTDAGPTGSIGQSGPTSESKPTTDNLGGFGAPSQTPGEFAGPNPTYHLTGTLRLADNGCWYVEVNGIERLVVLPVGYELDAVDSAVLRDPDQRAFRHGDPVDGSARFVLEAQLPGGADGKWGNYVDFCGPELREVAVFDDLAPASDPAETGSANSHGGGSARLDSDTDRSVRPAVAELGALDRREDKAVPAVVGYGKDVKPDTGDGIVA